MFRGKKRFVSLFQGYLSSTIRMCPLMTFAHISLIVFLWSQSICVTFSFKDFLRIYSLILYSFQWMVPHHRKFFFGYYFLIERWFPFGLRNILKNLKNISEQKWELAFSTCNLCCVQIRPLRKTSFDGMPFVKRIKFRFSVCWIYRSSVKCTYSDLS